MYTSSMIVEIERWVRLFFFYQGAFESITSMKPYRIYLEKKLFHGLDKQRKKRRRESISIKCLSLNNLWFSLSFYDFSKSLL